MISDTSLNAPLGAWRRGSDAVAERPPDKPVPIVPANALKRLFAVLRWQQLQARRDTALLMLLDTGARHAEMTGLTLDDLDLDVVAEAPL